MRARVNGPSLLRDLLHLHDRTLSEPPRALRLYRHVQLMAASVQFPDPRQSLGVQFEINHDLVPLGGP
jgi:hypothetical protein